MLSDTAPVKHDTAPVKHDAKRRGPNLLLHLLGCCGRELLLLSLAVARHPLQSRKGLDGHSAGLRVSNLIGRLLETGQEQRQETLSIGRVVDELHHVVNDLAGLTPDSGGALAQTAEQEGNHEGEGGGADSLSKRVRLLRRSSKAKKRKGNTE